MGDSEKGRKDEKIGREGEIEGGESCQIRVTSPRVERGTVQEEIAAQKKREAQRELITPGYSQK